MGERERERVRSRLKACERKTTARIERQKRKERVHLCCRGASIPLSPPRCIELRPSLLRGRFRRIRTSSRTEFNWRRERGSTSVERRRRRKNENFKSLTSPGPPLTATSGLLLRERGGARRNEVDKAPPLLLLLLVLQTPRAEEAWRRRIVRRKGKKRLEKKKKKKSSVFSIFFSPTNPPSIFFPLRFSDFSFLGSC